MQKEKEAPCLGGGCERVTPLLRRRGLGAHDSEVKGACLEPPLLLVGLSPPQDSCDLGVGPRFPPHCYPYQLLLL